jgi:hypothetical protein
VSLIERAMRSGAGKVFTMQGLLVAAPQRPARPLGAAYLVKARAMNHGLRARVRRALRRAPMSFTRRGLVGKLRAGAPACLALSGNSYNWSANTEQQLQEAASPQRLLPGCLQR